MAKNLFLFSNFLPWEVTYQHWFLTSRDMFAKFAASHLRWSLTWRSTSDHTQTPELSFVDSAAKLSRTARCAHDFTLFISGDSDFLFTPLINCVTEHILTSRIIPNFWQFPLMQAFSITPAGTKTKTQAKNSRKKLNCWEDFTSSLENSRKKTEFSSWRSKIFNGWNFLCYF